MRGDAFVDDLIEKWKLLLEVERGDREGGKVGAFHTLLLAAPTCAPQLWDGNKINELNSLKSTRYRPKLTQTHPSNLISNQYFLVARPRARLS